MTTPVTDFFIKYFLEKNFKAEPKLHDYLKAFRKFYEKFDSLTNKQRRFFLDLPIDYKEEVRQDIRTNKNFLDTYENVYLGKSLVVHMTKVFWDFIQDIKVKDKEPIQIYMDQINKYNHKVDRDNAIKKELMSPEALKKFKPKMKVDKNRLSFILLGLENYRMHELQQLLDIPSRTWARYKAELKLLGIDKQCIAPLKSYNAPIDYSSYLEECIWFPQKLFINKSSQKLFTINQKEFIS